MAEATAAEAERGGGGEGGERRRHCVGVWWSGGGGVAAWQGLSEDNSLGSYRPSDRLMSG